MQQGEADCGNDFQSTTEEKVCKVIPNLIQWLDEFLQFGKTEEGLIISLEKPF